MNIQMTGIDHRTAGIEVRERFAFTKAQAAKAMEYVKMQPDVNGCILLSTCNRMELWASLRDGVDGNLREMIAALKQADLSDLAPYFTDRQAAEAVTHLFYLTAGLKSQVFCEDQILSQVGDALKNAREIYCTDSFLEVLFRRAVTAAKEVKTTVPAMHGDVSAAHCAIGGMKQKGYDFTGKQCLVIGNGQMGKIAAQALQEEGAAVTVTVRQYKSGRVEIPKNCGRIHYGERYAFLPRCDVIVSATASPNLTIQKEPLAQARGGGCRQQILIDLAVPRDIAKEVSSLDGVFLYDMDDFATDGESPAWRECKQAAGHLLQQRIQEFWDWQECRQIVPRIQRIGRGTAKEVCWRMGGKLSAFSATEREQIKDMAAQSAEKSVSRLLFALRDHMGREELEHCMDLLEACFTDTKFTDTKFRY